MLRAKLQKNLVYRRYVVLSAWWWGRKWLTKDQRARLSPRRKAKYQRGLFWKGQKGKPPIHIPQTQEEWDALPTLEEGFARIWNRKNPSP